MRCPRWITTSRASRASCRSRNAHVQSRCLNRVRGAEEFAPANPSGIRLRFMNADANAKGSATESGSSDLRQWIGKTECSSDVIAATPYAALAATLDQTAEPP